MLSNYEYKPNRGSRKHSHFTRTIQGWIWFKSILVVHFPSIWHWFENSTILEKRTVESFWFFFSNEEWIFYTLSNVFQISFCEKCYYERRNEGFCGKKSNLLGKYWSFLSWSSVRNTGPKFFLFTFYPKTTWIIQRSEVH